MAAAFRPRDSLPNLPGYKPRLHLDPADRRHYKKTTLTYLKGYAMDEPPVHADLEAPPCPFSEGKQIRPAAPLSLHNERPTDGRPKWLEHDKKVLCWNGYFKEAVPESPHENHRVRQVVLCYYLCDDTMEVLEPRVMNSGICQGTFLRRHKIPKPDGQPYTEKDIKVGQNLCMYARVFRIVDADTFTRDYLSHQNITLAPAEGIPIDPYNARLAKTSQEANKSRKTPAVPDSNAANGVLQLGRFQAYLLNSKKVLRFYCVWDDRQRLYGDRRPLRLHYFLEDGTVEILEDYEQNSGREHFPVFLQRSQLPKDPTATKGGRILDKKLCLGVEDLRIGTFIFVYGRHLFIYNCDNFTRKWYRDNLAYPVETMTKVDISEPLPENGARVLPPYNGYGSLADSAESCKHLILKPPKKDFYKLINKSNIVLRFGARFLRSPTHPVSEDHREREFVVSYFMADDSISIFEHPTDGFSGGKFLERGQVPVDKQHSGDIITDRALFVGAELIIHKHYFMLESADEYTLQYMENNCRDYPMADWEASKNAAAYRLRGVEGLVGGCESLRAAIVETDKAAVGWLSADGLMQIMNLAGAELSKHQAISICRRLSKASATPHATTDALLHLFEC